MLKNLSRKEVLGVLAGLVLIMILRGAALDLWTAAGSTIGAGAYLLIRNYFARGKKALPPVIVGGIEWTKSDLRYVEWLCTLFLIAPAYLLFLTLWIGVSYSTAVAWLEIFRDFLDLIKPTLPAQDLSHYLVMGGGTADQTLILNHFEAFGQLGTFVSTITVVILSLGSVSRSIQRSKNFMVTVSVLTKLAMLAVIFSAIWFLIGQSEQLFFYANHDNIKLNYGMIISYFSLLPTAIGFWVWLISIAFKCVIYRGLRWR